MAIMENSFDLSMSPRYAEWLRYVFDRPARPDAPFFDLHVEPFCAGPCELAGLIASTFEHCGRDLAAYCARRFPELRRHARRARKGQVP